jgi:hypothetical protein
LTELPPRSGVSKGASRRCTRWRRAGLPAGSPGPPRPPRSSRWSALCGSDMTRTTRR